MFSQVIRIMTFRGQDTTTVQARRPLLAMAGMKKARPLLMTVASVILFLAAWQFLSSVVFTPYMVPPPTQVFDAAIPMAESGEIFVHMAISMVRVLVGFILGSVVAVVLGLAMGQMRLVHDLLDPIVEFLRYLSPTAMIPIAVIWFGIGEMSKYFLIFWGTFFFVLINTVTGVLRAPAVRLRAAECLGASRAQIFAMVLFPSAIPYIVTGMRVAMASSFMSIIPAEMLAADSGLGYLLQTAGMLAQTERIFVALATISLLGFATDRLFRLLVSRTLRRYMAHVTAA